MMRHLAAAWLILCGILTAHAQFVGDGIWKSVPSSFTCSHTWCGPGDIVATATAWGGFRAYSFAAGGTKAANICNVSDVVCADLSTSASTGQLVVTTIGGSNCGVVVCTVKTLYDQTGNANDWTNATIANRPVFVTNCQSSQPCMSCLAGSSQVLVEINSLTVAQPLTYSVVVIQTAGAGARAGWVGATSSGNAEAGFDPGAGNGYMYAGGGIPTPPLSTNAWHAVQTVFNSTTSTFYADGSSTTTNPGATGITGSTNRLEVCASANGSLSGKVGEIGLWPIGFNATQNSNINSNQHSFWGF